MDTVTLDSGRQVVIRHIRPDDSERLKAAYRALSPKSKYQRFLAPKPRLTETDTHYLVDVDGRNHVALVAVSPNGPDRLLGVARFVRDREDPEVAEFAIVVGDPYQREGLGSALLQQLAKEATARNIRRFTATTLAANLPVHRLMRSLGGELVHERHLGSVDELEVELAP
jgi:RimJ/RimL family protein N-acetyltransferase